jgi:four helix bundle protein
MRDDVDNAKPWEIPARTFQFAVDIVRLCRKLSREPGASRQIAGQLLDAATSVGSNVEEGQAAQSRADFASKYNIALKEIRETGYWLRILVASGIQAESDVSDLIQESGEIAAILGKSLVTVRKGICSQTPAKRG